MAIGAYLLGGPLADRFSAHRLLSAALIMTALGGFVLASFPSPSTMRWLYGIWGITTILLFWASLMRATRLVGGDSTQGFAFGLLDGGRGLFSALVSTASVYILSLFLPDGDDPVAQQEGFRMVILFFTALVILVGILVWFSLQSLDTRDVESPRLSANISRAMKEPLVWIQGGIILCAYSGYKITDDFSLMAQDILGYDKVESAALGTMAFWIRPAAAIVFGLFADRFKPSRMMMVCFVLMLVAGSLVGFGFYEGFIPASIILAICTSAVGVYAMRGLYFAVMEESHIPIGITGTVVGMASVIGYLPDIYIGPLMGHLLDSNPGPTGHELVFLVMSGFALGGVFLTLLLRRQLAK